MALVAPFLILILIILCLLCYLKNFIESRRQIKITSMKLVKNVENGERESKICINSYPQPPGPIPWPILGNLITLGKYDIPFVGLTELAKQYGDIYSLTLGSTRCLVVNNLELIREVLNQNGKFFGGRPDFLRFHTLFGGDRANSLALCDWSNLQQKRRNLARKHCSPRDSSSYYAKMSEVGCLEMQQFMDHIKTKLPSNGQDFHIKPLIQQTCANMFSQYMCSTRFQYDDTNFINITKCFDDIFWEINQGYAVDFLPWLAPFYKGHMNQIITWSTKIRHFILERIIEDRELHLDADEPEKDFTDALLKSLLEDPDVERDTIIYMLEDFLGGHSAIGNLVMICLGYICKYPEIGMRIQQEVDEITKNGSREVTLFDTESMPYTVATIYEVLRYSSSPIVPHVATEDACIAGYGITKGTMVFINNYELNTSEKYWEQPEIFNPERFLENVTNDKCESTSTLSTSSSASSSSASLSTSEQTESEYDSGIENELKDMSTNLFNIDLNNNSSDSSDSSDNSDSNTTFINSTISSVTTTETISSDETEINTEITSNIRLRKNIPHFLPFSIGKRTCIGQNLVKGFSFIMLANIMQTYDVSISDPKLIKMYPACVAVPSQTYPLSLTLRTSSS